MKNGLLAILILAAAFISTSFTFPETEKWAKVTVHYSFKGVVEGYDHETRTLIYIDNELVGVSTVKKESQPNSVSASTTKGKHRLRVVNQALYNGSWDEHTIANDYSIDCVYHADIHVTKELTTELVFDLDDRVKRVK